MNKLSPTEKKSNKQLLIILGVLALGIVVWWLYNNLEWKEEHYDLGWSPEANRSPYLIVDKFLTHYDTEVRILQKVPASKEIESADSIFLVSSEFLPLSSQHEMILRWVEDGGHLVVGAGDEDASGLLTSLGFSTDYQSLAVYDRDEDDIDNQDESNESDEVESKKEEKSFADRLREENKRIKEEVSREEKQDKVCKAFYDQCQELIEPNVDTSKLVKLIFETDEQEITVYSRSGKTIDHPKMYDGSYLGDDVKLNQDAYDKLELYYWAGDEKGIRFVQANYGRGVISVINDPEVFNNAHLGHFDHAYLLHLLLANTSSVIVLEGKHMAALSTLLWRYYREVIFGMLIFMFLGYRHLISRFGAVRDVVKSVRRSREEGMRAIGQWHWRRSESDILLKPLRSRVFEAASRKWPGFKRWDVQTQEQKISEISDIPLETVADVLAQETAKDEQQFLYLVKNLQKIRKAL